MYKVNWKFVPFLFLIDVLGSILFFWKKLWPFPRDIKKILIIRLDHIGDMVLTTPFFKEVRAAYPHAEISVLCMPLTRPMIENNQNIDKIIEWYSPWFSPKQSSGWSSFFSLAKELRKERYDVIFELHADPRNILLGDFIKTSNGYFIGYGVRGLGFLLNKAVSFKSGIEHTAQRNLDILEALHIQTQQPKLEVYASRNDEAAVEKLLKKEKLSSFVFIHPQTRRPEKNWSLRNWAVVCNNIKSPIIISGSKDDAAYIDEIVKQSKNKQIHNLAGKVSLPELVPLIKKAKYVITTDTLTTHIAAALDKKQIALFGPTNHELWGPLSKNAIVIQGTHAGLPKGEKEGTADCMNSITPEQVLAKLRYI